MTKSMLLVTSAALCSALCFNAEAKLYKWVDKDGTTHYGETIPPEYADREAKKLEKGRLVDRKDTFGDPNQDAVKQDTAADKAAKEARRRDNALLNSYSNEKEIDLARDRNLLQIEARINSYITLLKTAQATLDDLHKESNARTKNGQKIPQSLTDDIAASEARVASLQKDLASSQKEAEAMKARYEADKQRFRELRGLPSGDGK